MSKARVLVVENEGVVADRLRQRLNGLGYMVVGVVVSGEEAVAKAVETRPELVLMNTRLKDEGDGLAAEQMRALFDIPVVYLPPSDDEETLQRATSAAPFGYLLKAFEGRELHSRIELALYRHEMERKLKESEARYRRRSDEIALLKRIIAASTMAASEEEPTALLTTVCRELALAFDLPLVNAALFDDAGATTTVAAEYRLDHQPSSLGLTMALRRDTALRFLARHKQPAVIKYAQSEPNLAKFHDCLKQRGIVSVVILPLVVEQKTIGSLNLCLDEAHPLSAEAIDLAWSAARATANTLAHLRLGRKHQLLVEQYYQAQKMEAKGQLAADIAYDFNNLLTVINGFAELLLHRFELDTPQQKYLNLMLRSGQRAAELAHQLSGFGDKQSGPPQLLNLNDIVANIKTILPQLIGEDIELKTSLAPFLWPVEVDPAQIEQVIINLAANARDAMPAGGRLTIATANVTLPKNDTARGQEGEYVQLTVRDTGCGMNETVQTHLFEPFFTSKEKGKGTGLGLTTVYSIVKRHQGDIQVSSAPGRGAAFKIYLPRAVKTEAPPPPVVARAELPPGGETILLVEDEARCAT